MYIHHPGYWAETIIGPSERAALNEPPEIGSATMTPIPKQEAEDDLHDERGPYATRGLSLTAHEPRLYAPGLRTTLL